ncbi:MAG TPA: hypothetical protein PLR20_15195 [Syntrophales bacterium]|jgi:hypothetical protein|nr:hypothetical protein [Syntrophales bacterium]
MKTGEELDRHIMSGVLMMLYGFEKRGFKVDRRTLRTSEIRCYPTFGVEVFFLYRALGSWAGVYGV